jgi:Transposase and inactivated derivatives
MPKRNPRTAPDGAAGAAPGRLERICPYCQSENCIKTGRRPAEAWRQRYRCKQCHRTHTGVLPVRPREAGGPTVRVLRIGIGLRAQTNLTVYCSARVLSPQQAIREIFRQYAGEAGDIRVSTARVVYDPREQCSRIVVTTPRAHAPQCRPLTDAEARAISFADLRPENARRLALRRGSERYTPTVYIAVRLNVSLDALAVTGLVRAMRRTGLSHQDAARWLIQNARPPTHIATLAKPIQ